MRRSSMRPARMRVVTTADVTRSPAVLGEDDPAADGTDLMARPTDALQPAGDTGRGLDLDDEVDRAHVDAELEAARGDDGGQAAGLQVLLDERALLLADRSVVGAGDRLRIRDARGDGPGQGDLVHLRGDPLGEAPAVGEDQRRAVLLDEVDELLVDVRPDRRAGDRASGAARDLRRRAELGHVVDGHADLQVPLLLARGSDDGRRTGAGGRTRRRSPAGSPSPTGRCAAPAARAAGRAARATARGGPRAWCRRWHAPRRG